MKKSKGDCPKIYGAECVESGLSPNKKGLTLIELILTIAIVGIVIASVVAVLDLGLSSWRDHAERAELIQNSRIAMRRIIEELRYAQAQTVTYDNDASSPYLQFGTENLSDSNIRYIHEATNLYRSVDGGTTKRKIASSIDTFAITSTVVGLYEIELELSSGDNELELKNSAYPRN